MENNPNNNKLNSIRKIRWKLFFSLLFIILSSIFYRISFNGENSFDDRAKQIQDEFNNKINGLKSFAIEEQKLLSTLKLKDNLQSQLFRKLGSNTDDYFISVYDSNGVLIAWNENFRKINGSLSVTSVKKREPYLEKDNLFEIISLVDTFSISGIRFYYKTSFLLKKYFSLHNRYERRRDFASLISNKFNAEITPSVLGKQSSFPLLLGVNRIGAIVSRSGNFADNTFCLVSLVLLFVSLLLLFNLILRETNKIKGLYYFVLLAVLFRIISRFFFSDFETCGWAITKPEYFSSNFGFGFFDSLFSLFLSLVSFSIILFAVYRIKSGKNRSNKVFIIVTFLIFPFILRAFGATIRSLIYDSNIDVFSESISLTSGINLFYILNLFITGIVFSVTLFLLIEHAIAKLANKNFVYAGNLLLFLVLIFHYVQHSPQSPPMFKLLLTGTLIGLIYSRNNFIKSNKFLLLSFLSVLSIVVLLSYHHKDFENDLFKLATDKIVNPNNFHYKNLVEAESNNVLNRLKNKDYIYFNNSLAYKYWNSSRLPYESFSSSLEVNNTNKDTIYFYYNKNLNGFSTNPKFIAKANSTDKDFSVNVSVDFSPVKLFASKLPEFFIADNQLAVSLVRRLKLQLLKFQNDSLVFSSLPVTFGKEAKKNLLNIYDIKGEKIPIIFLGNKEYEVIPARKIAENKLYLLAKPVPPFSKRLYLTIRISAYLFALLLIYLILLRIKKLKAGVRLNYRTAIFSGLILVSIIPLILLAIYFRNLSEEKNSSSAIYKLNRKAYNVAKLFLKKQPEEADYYSVFEKISRDLKYDFSVFYNKKIFYTTHPLYFENGILPDILSPRAISGIEEHNLTGILLWERIENYNRRVYYLKIPTEQEFVIQIDEAFNPVTVPISESEFDEMLITSYSVTAVVIILLGFLLAYFLSKPVKELTAGTRKIAGGDLNLSIKTRAFGEVKELVESFNRMASDLKATQKKLLESERETAWREMARQVAHEIKNPLTPMKLSLQQLIAMKKEKDENFDSAFEKISASLLSQIDLLKNIASEFSAFGKMPVVKLKKIKIIELLNKVKSLYSEKEINITIDNSLENIEVNSDEEYLTRIFVNLISNAIDAKAKNIKIYSKQNSEDIEIYVANDGSKIPDEMHEKIFDKNFSTKEKGSGLGLYLSRRFLEGTNAAITLEKSDDNETIFKLTFTYE